MKNLKINQNAITLIALVVTIVVLLILATVSISMLTGENGLIAKAKQAKDKTEQAKLEEEQTLNDALNIILDNEKDENTENSEMTLDEAKAILKDKTIACVGDSLMYGFRGKGFGEYIREETGATILKWCMGGSTISDNTPGQYRTIKEQAETLKNAQQVGGYNDIDLIIFDGGGNDIISYSASGIDPSLKKEVGTIDKSSLEPSSENTVAADFEEIIQILKTDFPNATICYLQPLLLDDDVLLDSYYIGTQQQFTIEQLNSIFQTNATTYEELRPYIYNYYKPNVAELETRRDDIFNMTKEATKKWNINYLDVSNYFANTRYTYREADMIHINDAGYIMLNTPIIKGLAQLFA